MAEDNGNAAEVEGSVPSEALTPGESTITFRFVETGSAQFELDCKNVTPAQIGAASAYLSWFAQTQYAQQMRAQQVHNMAASRIARPGLVLAPGSMQKH